MAAINDLVAAASSDPGFAPAGRVGPERCSCVSGITGRLCLVPSYKHLGCCGWSVPILVQLQAHIQRAGGVPYAEKVAFSPKFASLGAQQGVLTWCWLSLVARVVS